MEKKFLNAKTKEGKVIKFQFLKWNLLFQRIKSLLIDPCLEMEFYVQKKTKKCSLSLYDFVEG